MDIKDALDFVAPKVREAALKAAAQLEQLGIRHALAGGLAVGAHGYIRATAHVDFLVGEEAFEHHGVLVTFRPGVPIEVDGVRIAYLSPVALGSQLEEVLDDPAVSEGLAVVPIEALIYMKLRARRRQDLLDVVKLIDAGADVRRVRAYPNNPENAPHCCPVTVIRIGSGLYLEQHASDLVTMFDGLVEEALEGQ